jgi:hypothetical protein
MKFIWCHVRCVFETSSHRSNYFSVPTHIRSARPTQPQSSIDNAHHTLTHTSTCSSTLCPNAPEEWEEEGESPWLLHPFARTALFKPWWMSWKTNCLSSAHTKSFQAWMHECVCVYVRVYMYTTNDTILSQHIKHTHTHTLTPHTGNTASPLPHSAPYRARSEGETSAFMLIAVHMSHHSWRRLCVCVGGGVTDK